VLILQFSAVLGISPKILGLIIVSAILISDEMYRNLSRVRPKGSDGMKSAIWKDYGTENGRNNDQRQNIIPNLI